MKRRLEKVFPSFADQADFVIQFQPFQLYPHLPAHRDDGCGAGVNKLQFFAENSKRAYPGESPATRAARHQRVVDAWAADGLELRDRYGSAGGNVGNSIDAQRLILLARGQGREDALIERIYGANHVEGRCLADWAVLEAAAAAAGVVGCREMLESDSGRAEVEARVEGYRQMGLNAVPVIILEGRFPLRGAPEPEVLRAALAQLLAEGTVDVAQLQQ